MRTTTTALVKVILCIILKIQEVVYLYMLIIATCLTLSVCRGVTSLSNVIEFEVN